MLIKVDKDLYSKEVLLKTAYSLTDKVYLHLDQDDHFWIVSWKPKLEMNIDAGEFENELISQALREKLIIQTADLRKIILARAYASTLVDTFSGDDNPPTGAQGKKDWISSNIGKEEEEEILRGWFDQP